MVVVTCFEDVVVCLCAIKGLAERPGISGFGPVYFGQDFGRNMAQVQPLPKPVAFYGQSALT